MQQDPLGYIDGANRYQYESNNTLNSRDPSGLYDQVFGPDFFGYSPDQWRNIVNSCPYPIAQPTFQLVTQPTTLTDEQRLAQEQKKLKDLKLDSFRAYCDLDSTRTKAALNAAGYPTTMGGDGSTNINSSSPDYSAPSWWNVPGKEAQYEDSLKRVAEQEKVVKELQQKIAERKSKCPAGCGKNNSQGTAKTSTPSP